MKVNVYTFIDKVSFSLAFAKSPPLVSVLLLLPPTATDATLLTVLTVEETVDVTVDVTVEVTLAAALKTKFPPYIIFPNSVNS